MLLLQPVRFFDQTVGEVMRNFGGFVFIQAMFGDKSCQKSAIHAARDIVARRNGKKCAGVVIEADRIAETRGFGGLFAEAHHAFGAIVKPPRRAEAEAWIVSGERREVATVSGFVEREKNDREISPVA